jgi:uncharacterized protein YbbC (DUF1343 family)
MVRNGIDRLESQLDTLRRLRVGVITNHTGLTAAREPLVDLLQRLGITIGALFSPEHGIRGQLDETVPDGVDERTGLPIYSLYSERKKPTPQQLAGVDALLFDIQDIGARYYTYISTMGLAMEAAAERGIPFYVLDRVNPIGGQLEGPLADPDRLSFTAYHTIALRHGMTVGELAQMFNTERGIGADLKVIPCEGWKRSMLYDACGLYWTNPSPNMRRLQQAFLYIGIGVWEGTNLSVGRGTDTPFELVGAPWMDGRALAGMLNELPTSAACALCRWSSPRRAASTRASSVRACRCSSRTASSCAPSPLESGWRTACASSTRANGRRTSRWGCWRTARCTRWCWTARSQSESCNAAPATRTPSDADASRSYATGEFFARFSV